MSSSSNPSSLRAFPPSESTPRGFRHMFEETKDLTRRPTPSSSTPFLLSTFRFFHNRTQLVYHESQIKSGSISWDLLWISKDDSDVFLITDEGSWFRIQDPYFRFGSIRVGLFRILVEKYRRNTLYHWRSVCTVKFKLILIHFKLYIKESVWSV